MQSLFTFTSHTFLLIVIILSFVYYFFSPKKRPVFLLFLSCAFYIIVEKFFFINIIFLIFASFLISKLIAINKNKLFLLIIFMLILLTNLLLFKYFFTFLNWKDYVIPLGISYYSFRIAGYVLDIYWGKYLPEKNIIKFSLYVLFFPQIIAGPITEPKFFFNQIEKIQFSENLYKTGLILIIFGLFKKLVVADYLDIVVGPVFENPTSYSGLSFLFASYLWAFQIYADFSGLIDISIGVGRLFGINAPKNFDMPFYSSNITDFWNRWHITLTNWIKNYIFVPLNFILRNKGSLGMSIAIIVNMLVIAIWHKATLGFVVFGLLNSAFVLFYVFFFINLKININKIISILVVFHCMVLSFIFLRTPTLFEALFIIKNIIPFNLFEFGQFNHGLNNLGIISNLGFVGIVSIVPMEIIHLVQKNIFLKNKFFNLNIFFRFTVYFLIFISTFLLGSGPIKGFVYAQF